MKQTKRQFKTLYAIAIFAVLASATLLIAVLAADKPEQDEFEKHLKMLEENYDDTHAHLYFMGIMDGEDGWKVQHRLGEMLLDPDVSDKLKFGICSVICNRHAFGRYYWRQYLNLAINYAPDEELPSIFQEASLRYDPALAPILLGIYIKRKNALMQYYGNGNTAEERDYMIVHKVAKYPNNDFTPLLISAYNKTTVKSYQAAFYEALAGAVDRDERAWRFTMQEWEKANTANDIKLMSRYAGDFYQHSQIRALPVLFSHKAYFDILAYADHRVILFLTKQHATDKQEKYARSYFSLMTGWDYPELDKVLHWYRENADNLMFATNSRKKFSVIDYANTVSELKRSCYEATRATLRERFDYQREIEIPGSKVFTRVRKDLMDWWEGVGRLRVWLVEEGRYKVFDIPHEIDVLSKTQPGKERDEAVNAFFEQFDGSVLRIYPVDKNAVLKDPSVLNEWWAGVNLDYLYVDWWKALGEDPRVFCDVDAARNKITVDVWQKLPREVQEAWKTLSEDERKQHLDKINADIAAEKALTEQARTHKIAVCIWRHIDEQARAKWDTLSVEEREKHLCAAEEILLNPPFEVRIEDEKAKDAESQKATP